ncbi:MAG: protein kinase [Acidobacteriia bacterium]|nr:protein kinase [Terriglobia bacterium]
MGSPTGSVECPACHHSNAPGASRCASCHALLASSDATMTHVDVNPGWSRATRAEVPVARGELSLEVGSVIAGRYEILKLLGEGGMGAVYKARDNEVDRLIAVKVIRPELASHSSVLQRFKQELILARSVTHRNVIRIYDLGVAEGCRFITMEFVEGRDLSSVLEERKLGPEEAVKVTRQICAALEVAHAEGVVHRDLKPQNVMLESSGRVVVMDFGLARSMETTGLTQAGAIMGTPAYMSPEQAKGMPADERSDIFSVGIMMYQMLTGVVPFKGDTALASLLLRTQGPPKPPMEIQPSIPKALNDIVLKALATDPANRYQKAADFSKDLHDWEEGTLHQAIVTPPIRMMSESTAGKWIAIAVAAMVVLATAIYGGYRLLNRTPPVVAPMTVLIADFNNHTGDEVFTGTLESTLKLALEGASFIGAYDRSRVRELGLDPISGSFDEPAAEAIAASQGLNVVVSGSIDRRGTEYQLSLRAVRTVTGKVLANVDATAPNKDQVLFAVTKVGAALRKALGDSTSESEQRLSMETLSSANLEAVHEYASGLDTLSAGKFADAQTHLSRAVELDPNFGMAYTIMASAARNQGHFQDAEQYIRNAIKLTGRMTERERYRTRAYLYFLTGDYQNCTEEYSSLLDRYPADTGAYTNLGVCLAHQHNIPKSLDVARRAVALLPKRAIYHSNLAMDLVYSGDFAGAVKEAGEAMKLGYVNGYLIEAFARLGQEQPDAAAEAYHNLEKTLPSDAATGLADLAVYEGRYQDAANMLEKGAEQDLSGRRPDKDAAATKYWMLAHVQLLRKQNPAAMAAAKLALDNNQGFQTRLVAGQVYVAIGEEAKARDLANGLANELQVEPQAYAKLIDGELAMKQGDGKAAVKLFTEANNLLDTWMGRFDLGRAYLQIEQYPDADSEFDRCIKRRGEATSLFLDLSTYGYFPPVYYYQGRAREGMKTAGYADSYKKYLAIRGKSSEDALAADARKRESQ